MTAGGGCCFRCHCCKVRSSSSSQTSKSSTNDTYMVYNFGTMVIVIVIANGGGSVGNVRITAFCWRLRGSEHRCHCIKMKSFRFVYTLVGGQNYEVDGSKCCACKAVL